MQGFLNKFSWPQGLIALDALVVGAALSAILGAWLYTSHANSRHRRGLPYPPGPPRLPFIGNLLDMPNTNEWIVYRDWARKYESDVVHIEIFGAHIIVINSAKAASDLFDKRSSLYSDRPTLTSLVDYLGFDWVIGFLPYGAQWRAVRRAFHAHFHPAVAKTYESLEEVAAHRLLRNLVQSPKEFRQHTRHMAGQVILRIAYGIDVLPQSDPFVALAEQALHSITLATTLSGSIFDMVPFLKHMPWWFPGAGFKKEARKWRPIVQEMVDAPFAATQGAIDGGKARSSVAASIIENDVYDPLMTMKQLPANLYLGGADTTVSAIQTFFLAMVLNPGIQRKAQEEIDSVLGGTRLPTHEDEDILPYTSALVKEVQRWHPVLPLSLPHALTDDDVYDGHFLPAGATVLGNVWAILHDPSVFPDPESFRPEHFLPQSSGGTLNAARAGRATEAHFGFGRRECPGRYMARASVWIAIVSVLAVFEILPAVDEQGREIPVEEKYTSGFIAYPAPFHCEIKPRSGRMRELALATASE